MSKLLVVFLVLGVAFLLLSGCFGSTPAKSVSNNTTNTTNTTNASNTTLPQNQTPPPAPPVQNNSSAVPPVPNETIPIPPAPPEINNSSITPPAVIITPTVSGNAVIDRTNGTFTTKSCYGIEATPSIIAAGKESTLHFRGYAANSEAITYTCAGEVRSNGNGGLIDFTRICKYPDAGHYTIWIALDGYVCASTPLEVEPVNAVSVQPFCVVAANSQNEVLNGTETTYSAKVLLYNQLPRASIDWDCGQTHFNRTVGSVFGVTSSRVSGSLLVTCGFDTWPPPSPGSVSIDGADCGSMSAG